MAQTVDLTNVFSLTILSFVVRALIVFIIAHSCLEDRFNSFVTLISITVGTVLYTVLTMNLALTLSEMVVMFGYYVVVFLILVAVAKGKLYAKLFTSFLSLLAHLSATMMLSLSFNLLGIPVSYLLAHEQPISIFFIILLFQFAFSFLPAALIRLIKGRIQKKNLDYSLKHAIFFVFPITHVFAADACFLSQQALLELQADTAQSTFFRHHSIFVLFAVACMVLDLLLIFLVDYIDKVEVRNREQEKQILLNRLDYNQIQSLREEKKHIRKIRHDFTNLTATAAGMLEIGNTQRALELLTKTGADIGRLGNIPLCSNELINTVLAVKQQQAQDLGVSFQAEVEEGFAVAVEDYDLCRVLCNLIDNLLNATAALPANTANKPSKLTVDIEEDSIRIETENAFDKTAKAPKKDAHRHGYGTKIIKEIAEKYNGSYRAEAQEDTYFTTTILQNKSV